MESGWVWSSGLQLSLMMLVLMLSFSLLCGFGSLCLLRRAAGVRPRAVSLAGCVSSGVFLSSCLLELLPDALNQARQTFSRLSLALHFPLAEFLLAMGFLLVLVAEQMLLAVRDPEADDVPLEKQALVDAECPDALPDGDAPGRWRRLSRADGSEDGKGLVGLRVFLLALCVCVRALLQGLGFGAGRAVDLLLQSCVPLLLHEGLLAFSLSALLVHHGLRRALLSGCLLLFSLMCPAGIGMGLALAGTAPSTEIQLVRCAVEALTAGVFLNVSTGGLLWQEPASPKHRVHKVAFLLTGFALVTAVRFSRV